MTRKKDKAKDPVSVSIYLDTRRKKENGLFPVKIRVYDSITKKARLYSTDFDLTEKSFTRIIFPEKGQRLREEETEIRNYFYGNPEKPEEEPGLYNRFRIEYSKIKSNFSFEIFESNLLEKNGNSTDVFSHFETYIKELRAYNRIGTASSYELCMKSLKAYLKDKTKKEPKILQFQDITVKFLNDYEDWMTVTKGRSLTTVGIYLRGLRVIFNRAIDQKIIDKEFYPFGVKKYEIPASSNTKKAFDSNQLKTLFNAVPKIEEQQKAKDYWFFSFVCNGMNIKDILYLKWKNIENDQIIFVREKTKRTKKANSKSIQVPLTDFARSFIEKYGNQDQDKNNYVFPVLNKEMTEEKKHKVKLNFIRFINQHLKNLAKANGLTEDISSYWARHSFSTQAIRKKASMEFVSEALGHSDLKTTKNYFAGFEDKTKKEILEDITDFMKK